MNNSLSQLSNEQLISKYKSLKNEKIIDALIIGVTIGIFSYGLTNYGFGFFTFFPLIICYLIIKNSANKKLLEQEVAAEIQSRNISL